MQNAFDVNIISTGSQGNCVVIDHSIMCDAGISRHKIIASGYNLNNLQVLLISHKHTDHANLPMIRWAIKHHVEVHLPMDVITKLKVENRIDLQPYLNQNVFIHENQLEHTLHLKSIENQDAFNMHLVLHPERHHDIINYAFVMEKDLKNEKVRLLYSTDLDTIGPTDVGPGLTSLGMFDTIILEGNYDEIWLRDYIRLSIGSIDEHINTSLMNDEQLDSWVHRNYRQLPRDMAAGLFRAVQNMRHISKQQARIYARNHLLHDGDFYEVHRSHMFYERPSNWDGFSY